MDRLAPCIKCNSGNLDYIRGNLLRYGYKVIGPFNEGTIIVTDYCNIVGTATSLCSDCNMTGRELVTDIEEFLIKAAKFIGYMKEEFTKEDLKPGMLVEYDGRLCLVCNSRDGLCLKGEDWSKLLDDSLDLVTKIWGFSIPILSNSLSVAYRKLLYEKKIEKVLTMQEIADKFNIPVEQLRIKK